MPKTTTWSVIQRPRVALWLLMLWQQYDSEIILTDYEGECPDNQGKDGVDESDEDCREETTLEDRGQNKERPRQEKPGQEGG